MALTTAAAFDTFKAKIQLTEAQSTTVNDRRMSINGYIADAFPSTSNMPLLWTRLIGSAARGTIIRPLDDIDVLAKFDNKDGIFETYRHDSQAFIYRVRNAVNITSSVATIGTRGQAVRFFYNNKPHVDVVPVFGWNSGGYALPNGSGGWLTTDPDAHHTYIDDRNRELSHKLKPLIRMIKRWNNVHSKRLRSFHLEVMVAKAFNSLGADSRDASEKFFAWAKNNLTVFDPAGHSGDLSDYLSWTDRSNVITSFESARERAYRANAAENAGDHEEAIRLWRIIYGEEFPSYG